MRLHLPGVSASGSLRSLSAGVVDEIMLFRRLLALGGDMCFVLYALFSECKVGIPSGYQVGHFPLTGAMVTLY